MHLLHRLRQASRSARVSLLPLQTQSEADSFWQRKGAGTSGVRQAVMRLLMLMHSGTPWPP